MIYKKIFWGQARQFNMSNKSNNKPASPKPKGVKPLQDIVPKLELENNERQKFSFEKLETLKDIESIFERGHRLANGFGVTKDVDRGWKLILEAAREGHPVALALCFTAGVETTRDDKRAVGLLKESAQRGHSVAQFNLGVCYIQGVGVDRNFSEAARYFKLAADQSFPAAQYNLGNCYGSGIGVSRDYALAAFYFKLSAENGRQDAKNALTIALGKYAEELKPELFRCVGKAAQWVGELDLSDENGKVVAYQRLMYGIGVDRNEVTARKIIFDAALQRQPVAISICIIEAIEFERNEKNLSHAVSLLQAFSHNPEASFYLGLCFLKGIGVEVDLKKAFDLFQASANKGNEGNEGNVAAIYFLAEALERGTGVDQNLALAIEKYTEAAQKGHSDALFKMSFFYRDGNGVTQSIEKALEALQQAAKLNHPVAIKEMSQIDIAKISLIIVPQASAPQVSVPQVSVPQVQVEPIQSEKAALEIGSNNSDEQPDPSDEHATEQLEHATEISPLILKGIILCKSEEFLTSCNSAPIQLLTEFSDLQRNYECFQQELRQKFDEGVIRRRNDTREKMVKIGDVLKSNESRFKEIGDQGNAIIQETLSFMVKVDGEIDKEEISHTINSFLQWKDKCDHALKELEKEKLTKIKEISEQIKITSEKLCEEKSDFVNLQHLNSNMVNLSTCLNTLVLSVCHKYQEIQQELVNQLAVNESHINNALNDAITRVAKVLAEIDSRFDCGLFGNINDQDLRQWIDYNPNEFLNEYNLLLEAVEDADTKHYALTNRKRAPFPSDEEKEASLSKLQSLIVQKEEKRAKLIFLASKHFPELLHDETVKHQIAEFKDLSVSDRKFSFYTNVVQIESSQRTYTGFWNDQKVVLKHYSKKNFKPMIDEVELLKSLKHSSIVQVNSVLFESDHAYVETPFYQTINTWLTANSEELIQNGRYESEILRLFKELVESLHYIHSQNIVHGNIKSKNLLISGNGGVLITGFNRSLKDGQFINPNTNPKVVLTKADDIHAVAVVTTKLLKSKKTVLSDILDWMLSVDPNLRPTTFSILKKIIHAQVSIRTGAPAYWHSLTDDQLVRRIDVTAEMKDQIQMLMNDSSLWSKSGELNPTDIKLGKDETYNTVVLGLKNELGMHKGYQVIKVERIENHRLWRKYHEIRRDIIQNMQNLRAKGYQIPDIKLECYADWQENFGLLKEANEIFGFHGCPANAVDKIVSEGFDMRVSIAQLRENRIAYGYFGNGIYLAENASKSDEYSQSDGFGMHSVFLTRASFGVPFISTADARTNPLQTVLPSKQNRLWALMRAPYIDEIGRAGDSLVHLAARVSDNKQSWPTKNNDFVIYDRTQAYPEFLITYRRIPIL